MRSLNVLLVVPTGIGAALGGYAGDAIPIARAIAAVADTVVTHPNVLNGASLFWPLPNTLYVEGYSLDRFARGDWGLRAVHGNRIGVVLDRAVAEESELYGRHLQAIAAARATLGLQIAAPILTDMPLGVELRAGDSGATWGTIAHPDSLLRAVDTAIRSQGAEAIAIVARFPDDPDSPALHAYRRGQGTDALAGAEAVISHLVSREFAIPCAHAPALQPLPFDPDISPRAAAEELGFTFLPCVLAGLSRAPQLVCGDRVPGDLWADDLDAAIAPLTACGGAAILSLAARYPHVRAIAVAENTTALAVLPEDVGVPALRAANYPEAIGLLAAIKAGIDPQSLLLRSLAGD